jgi:hypothetical protein
MKESITMNLSHALDSLFDAVPANIDTSAIRQSIKIPQDTDPEKAYKAFIELVNNAVIPKLANLIRQPGQSLAAAVEQLKQLHLNFLNDNNIVEIAARIDNYHSEQRFLTTFSPDQIKYAGKDLPLAKRNCYRRNGVGLAGLRKHQLKKGNDILIEYYHHASPVPYELSNFAQRVKITKQNFEQLKLNIDPENKLSGEVPMTQVRLLSPLGKPWRWFDFAQKQYDQTLETYFAMLRSNGNHRMFVYGTNMVRGRYDELQTLINTRATNDLFIDMIKYLGSNDKYAKKIAQLQYSRRKTLERIREIELKDEDEAKEQFIGILRSYHHLEKDFAKYCEKIWQKHKEKNTVSNDNVSNDFDMALRLMHNNSWAKKQHNYQLQAILVRLDRKLGRHVATGCNDGKDRDGRLAVTIEANEIYRDKHNHYPDPFNQQHRKVLQKLESEVYLQSTPRLVAAAVSIPGANHMELKDSDGNAHIPTRPYLARLFKDMHHLPLSLSIQDHLSTAVKQEKTRKGNWLAASVMGVMLTVFTSLFGIPVAATATTVNTAPATAMARDAAPASNEKNSNTREDAATVSRSQQSPGKMGRQLGGKRGNKREDSVLGSRTENKKDTEQKEEEEDDTAKLAISPTPPDTPPRNNMACAPITRRSPS